MPGQKAAQRLIEPLLASGERVLWAERPEARGMLWKSLRGILVFAAFTAGLIYFFYAEAAVGVWQRMTAGEASAAAYAFPAVVLGLMAWSVLSSYRRTGRTAYALTDRRLLQTTGSQNSTLRDQSGAFRSGEWSLFPEHVALVQVRKEGGGVGDVVFNRYGRTDSTSGGSTRQWVGFQQIPAPQDMQGRVHDWLKERERNAVDEAQACRSFTDAGRGVRLDVPAAWHANAVAGRFYVFGENSPTALQEAPGTETLVERYGPLAAFLSLSAGPAGTWRFEAMCGTDGDEPQIAEVVEAQPEVHVAGLPGFAVTREVTVLPTFHGHLLREASAARVKRVVLNHGDEQYHFALAWLCAFPAMKDVLEQTVERFRVAGR
jgi:hypothetical protein